MLQLLGRTQVIYYINYTQSGKSVHCLFEKQITMGRRSFRKSEKSVQTYANQHGTLCARNHLFHSMCGVLYGSEIQNHIVDAASMWSLFLVISNDFKNTMGSKFTNIQPRCPTRLRAMTQQQQQLPAATAAVALRQDKTRQGKTTHVFLIF